LDGPIYDAETGQELVEHNGDLVPVEAVLASLVAQKLNRRYPMARLARRGTRIRYAGRAQSMVDSGLFRPSVAQGLANLTHPAHTDQADLDYYPDADGPEFTGSGLDLDDRATEAALDSEVGADGSISPEFQGPITSDPDAYEEEDRCEACGFPRREGEGPDECSYCGGDGGDYAEDGGDQGDMHPPLPGWDAVWADLTPEEQEAAWQYLGLGSGLTQEQGWEAFQRFQSARRQGEGQQHLDHHGRRPDGSVDVEAVFSPSV
jgi:hypothetical protein